MLKHTRRQHLTLSLGWTVLGCLALAASAQAQYGSNVKIVSSCTELTTELGNITDAANNNRYLIKIEPGKYECGTQSIVMKEWIDIEGSGVESTLIRGLGSVTHQVDGVTATALITGASNAELRNLSIKTKHTGEDLIGILNSGVASLRVTNVDLDVVDGDSCWGILNDNPVPVPADCADAANPTLTSFPVLRGVEINAAKCSQKAVGLSSRGRSNPEVRRSYIMGVNSPVKNIGIDYNVQCLDKQEKKVLRDVEASAYGISDFDTGVCYGVTFEGTEIEEFTIYNTTIAADNCGDSQNGGNLGLYSGDFILTMWNSQVRAKAGNVPESIGLGVDAGTVLVHNSTIRGDTHSVRAQNGAFVGVGASQLRGSVDLDASTATCAGVYDGNFTLFAGPGCP